MGADINGFELKNQHKFIYLRCLSIESKQFESRMMLNKLTKQIVKLDKIAAELATKKISEANSELFFEVQGNVMELKQKLEAFRGEYMAVQSVVNEIQSRSVLYTPPQFTSSSISPITGDDFEDIEAFRMRAKKLKKELAEAEENVKATKGRL